MKRAISLFIMTVIFISLFPASSFSVETAEDTGLLLLVNKNHPVDKNHTPDDLVSLGHTEYRMRAEAAGQMKKMLEACQAECGARPRYVSGYRSYNRQRSTFNTRINRRLAQGYSYNDAYAMVSFYTAPPGTSEHQTGLAMDISMDGTLTEAFGKTAAGMWLRDNSHRFGYILRYTADKSDYTMIGPESWHYRYVGTPHAQIMYENNWCLEEYMEALAKAPLTKVSDDGTVYKIQRMSSLPFKSDSIVSASSDNMGNFIVTTKTRLIDVSSFTDIILPRIRQMFIAGIRK